MTDGNVANQTGPRTPPDSGAARRQSVLTWSQVSGLLAALRGQKLSLLGQTFHRRLVCRSLLGVCAMRAAIESLQVVFPQVSCARASSYGHSCDVLGFPCPKDPRTACVCVWLGAECCCGARFDPGTSPQPACLDSDQVLASPRCAVAPTVSDCVSCFVLQCCSTGKSPTCPAVLRRSTGFGAKSPVLLLQ